MLNRIGRVFLCPKDEVFVFFILQIPKNANCYFGFVKCYQKCKRLLL